MNFTTISRVIKLGFTNFRRNWWLSLVATLIMTLTLITISVFVIFNIVINTTTDSIKEKIDLSVYFVLDANEEQVQSVQRKVSSLSDVKSVNFVSKQEALERWQEMKISQKIKDQITDEDNPLPYSLDIKTHSSEDLEKVANYLASEEFTDVVERVSYKENKDLINKLINITDFSKKIGLVLGIIFVTISILVIFNTVKLTIYTRRKEIEIMRLVGANDVFIRMPFVVEALLYSLFATILSLLIIWISLYSVSPMITRYLGEVNLNLEQFFISNIIWIFIFELVVSSIISIGSSLISMQKNLKK